MIVYYVVLNGIYELDVTSSDTENMLLVQNIENIIRTPMMNNVNTLGEKIHSRAVHFDYESAEKEYKLMLRTLADTLVTFSDTI